MAWTPSASPERLVLPLGRLGCWSAIRRRTTDARHTLRWIAGIGNFAVMVMIGASFLPKSGLAQHSALEAFVEPVAMAPWLVLLMSSAIGSLLLITSGREIDESKAETRRSPVQPVHPIPGATEAPALEPRVSPSIAATSTEMDVRVAKLMARMGHDLRTPLTAIIGFSDIMEREMHGPLGSDRYQSYAGHIKDSGETLLQAIEQALAMTERLAEDDRVGKAK